MSFCNSCGEQVPENAKFCQGCGNEIIQTPTNDFKTESENKSEQESKKKSPATAAVINLLIAGLGFVYIEEYAKAIVSFLIVVIAAIFFGFIGGILALLLVILWTYDETNKYNKNLE